MCGPTTTRRRRRSYEISLDLFEGSGLEPARTHHHRLTAEVLERLHERGLPVKRPTRQFYDVKAGTFLNGRQVKGRCPVRGVKSEKAYADECDSATSLTPRSSSPRVSAHRHHARAAPLLTTGTSTADLPPELEAPSWTSGDADSQVRAIVTKTVRESLVDPVIYIQNKFREGLTPVR